ncbi:VOC family protein [Allokutzneria sp. NRRL B-24872]|uniref:VOC family protein n=1 Tax=Allokutzneria sp. NRRL B-24872 TaxID=1137961 RepID=UPI001AEF36BE|nr:VOC family protein [Allokutzneria sp. NRRL B-24872]
MTTKRMDHVGVVVTDLKAATEFFVALGMELLGEGPASGQWVDDIAGLPGINIDIAFLRTPDGHGQLELTSFRSPAAVTGGSNAPNAVGLRRVMFTVEDIHDTLARLRLHGGVLVGEVAQYEDSYLLCYVRGPEGIIVSLSQELTP